MVPFRLAAALLLAAAAAACSPTHDWRELRPDGAGVATLFPCKPDRHARSFPLGGQTVRMEMLVCSAGDATFALAFADVAEPGRVGEALRALRAASVANIGGDGVRSEPAQVSGMTPNGDAVRLSMQGALPDGAKVQEQVLLFARGLRVFQASVIGGRLAGETVETFFGGLKLEA